MLKIFHNCARIAAYHASKLASLKEFRRCLYSPAPLGLLDFDHQQHDWREKLSHRKDDFLCRLKKTLDEGDKLFTEDITALLHLADTDEDFSFALKTLEKYKELQEQQSFKAYFPVGETVLRMLHRHGQPEMALKWFLDKNSNVELSCRNRRCFLLMMDLLYEHGRFQDVVDLVPIAEVIFDRKYPELVTIVFASLYRMNTKESLNQMLTFLNELCTDPIQLPIRCLLMSCMLTYKQGEMYLMMEILQLPIFMACSKKLISTLPNIKMLAYIESGRYEEAVDILEDAVVKFQKPVNLFFDEVLLKLQAAVKSSGKIELESQFLALYRTLKASGFVFAQSMDDFMLGTIRNKEYEMIMNTDNPPQMYGKIRIVCDKLSLQETKALS